MGTKKNFVLDTNVILHDYNCLKNFQENDIYLPLVVLEELDKFKKGNEQINFNAREFVRELDVLTSDELFSEGVKLGEGLGRLFVVTSNVPATKVWESFPIRKPDHLILAATEYLTAKYPKMKSILVTKDVNLRMKARSIGLLCEDYITDKVVNVDVFEKSNEIFENVDPALIDRIYSSKEGLDLSEFDFKDLIHPNECFVLKSDRNSVLARYNPFTHSICRVMKGKNYGIEPRNAEQSFAFEILNDPNVKLVALTGKAGTGKTLLALAAALGKLTDYKQILLARKSIDKLTDFAKQFGAKGLAWVKMTDGALAGPVAKFLTSIEEKLTGALHLEENDLVLFVADTLEIANNTLGALRNQIAKELDMIDNTKFNFLWVVDWPMFEWSEEEGRYMSAHHPFTLPTEDSAAELEGDLSKVRAVAYDIVLNGYELGGGSLRINQKDLQERMLKALGFSEESAYEQFGFLLEAMDYGFPPHGGLALGLDRFVMLLAGKDNIREVIAFPKNNKASDPMTQAPSLVADKQLEELALHVDLENE